MKNVPTLQLGWLDPSLPTLSVIRVVFLHTEAFEEGLFGGSIERRLIVSRILRLPRNYSKRYIIRIQLYNIHVF